jgi:class 3 adenylate cyclase
MANPSDTQRSGHLSVALDEALTAETRKGSLLAIAGCLLFFAFQILNTLVDLVTKHQYPAFFRYPLGLLLVNLAGPLLSIPLYVIAMRSKRPLFWCVVCIVVDTLWVSELKFFWFAGPPGVDKLPIYLEVRYEDIGAFLMFLAIYSLPLSRRLTLWSAALMTAVWTAGIAYTYARYDGRSLYVGPFGPGIGDAGLRAFMNPEVLPVDFFVIQLLLLWAFAGFLVLAIDQGRDFVARRVRAEADSAFLRRFFPPALADRIASGGADDLKPTRRHVAILFAGMPATSDLARIRDDYLRFEEMVFAHDGVVDRFSGGPAMAVFGALDSDGKAVGQAIACAQTLSEMLATGERRAALALHAGDAICGNVGGAENRTFGAVGDVVNTARRMLDVAADGGTIVSDAIFAQLPHDLTTTWAIDLGEIKLRGRDAPVHLWRIRP